MIPRLPFFLFIALVLVIGWAIQPLLKGAIEADLTRKATPLFSQHGITKSQFRFEGPFLLPDATLTSADLHQELEQIAGAYVPPLRAGRQKLRKTSTLLLVQEGQQITLSGRLSTPQEIDLITQATSPWTLDKSDLIADSKLPPLPDIQALTETIKILVNEADSFRMSYRSSGQLTLGGILENKEQFEALLTAAESLLPKGQRPTTRFQFQRVQDLELRITKRFNSTVLSGVLPSEPLSAEIETLLRNLIPGAEIYNNTHIATRSKAQTWWLANYQNLLTKALPMIDGNFTFAFSENRLRVAGQTDSPHKLASLKKLSQDLPKNIRLEGRFTLDDSAFDPSSPQGKDLHQQLQKHEIYFGKESSGLHSRESAKIVALARIIDEATDSQHYLSITAYHPASDSVNETLLKERASLVQEKLIKLGVPSERLSVQLAFEPLAKFPGSESWRRHRVILSVAPKTL